jgi:tetratricopeptide (TPR) repeat protein
MDKRETFDDAAKPADAGPGHGTVDDLDALDAAFDGVEPARGQAATPASVEMRAELRRLLIGVDTYLNYPLYDKALLHLQKVFAIAPENLDAHEKAYAVYTATNDEAKAAEHLLEVLRLCTQRAEVERAQRYLSTILERYPEHPEVPGFVSALTRPDEPPIEIQPEPHPTESDFMGGDSAGPSPDLVADEGES